MTTVIHIFPLFSVYNWCPYKDVNMVNQLPNGAQFYPMLWGDKQIGEFTRLVKPGYASTVLGMNECVPVPV